MATTDLFEILGVRDAGSLKAERVLLRAKVDLEIGNFLVLIGSGIKDRIAPNYNHVYWFPNTSISAGDYIRLHSKAGDDARTTGKYGDTPAVFHNFYWKKSSPVWIMPNDSLVVLRAIEWNFDKVL